MSAAHAAATTASLLEERFTWGVGSGEALNEHITGQRWPPAPVRIEMLAEAIEVIRALWTGESITHRGAHFTVEDARIFDLPQRLPPIVVSAFGPDAAKVAAERGDGLWISGANAEVIQAYRDHGGEGPIWSQLSLCWDPDRDQAVDRAHRLWPNTAVPGQLGQDLPTVLHFEQAVQNVRREDLAAEVPCGPEPEPILEAIAEMTEAGVDHVYLHQIGDPMDGFLDFWEKELKTAL